MSRWKIVAVETSIPAGASSPTPAIAMSPFSPDPVRADTRDVVEGDRTGAWAAAAVLVIAVVLASGAVG